MAKNNDMLKIQLSHFPPLQNRFYEV